jgi:hypothetical protein
MSPHDRSAPAPTPPLPYHSIQLPIIIYPFLHPCSFPRSRTITSSSSPHHLRGLSSSCLPHVVASRRPCSHLVSSSPRHCDLPCNITVTSLFSSPSYSPSSHCHFSPSCLSHPLWLSLDDVPVSSCQVIQCCRTHTVHIVIHPTSTPRLRLLIHAISLYPHSATSLFVPPSASSPPLSQHPRYPRSSIVDASLGEQLHEGSERPRANG